MASNNKEIREFEELTVILKLKNGLDISKISAPKVHRFFNYLEKNTDIVKITPEGEYITNGNYIFKDRGNEYPFDENVVFVPSKRKGKTLGFIEQSMDRLLSISVRKAIDEMIIQLLIDLANKGKIK